MLFFFGKWWFMLTWAAVTFSANLRRCDYIKLSSSVKCVWVGNVTEFLFTNIFIGKNLDNCYFHNLEGKKKKVKSCHLKVGHYFSYCSTFCFHRIAFPLLIWSQISFSILKNQRLPNKFSFHIQMEIKKNEIRNKMNWTFNIPILKNIFEEKENYIIENAFKSDTLGRVRL